MGIAEALAKPRYNAEQRDGRLCDTEPRIVVRAAAIAGEHARAGPAATQLDGAEHCGRR